MKSNKTRATLRGMEKNGISSRKDRQKLMINLNMMRMVSDCSFILDQKTRHDTKIGELMGILEEVSAMPVGKVVIFSQWERLVARDLTPRVSGTKTCTWGSHPICWTISGGPLIRGFSQHKCRRGWVKL